MGEEEEAGSPLKLIVIIILILTVFFILFPFFTQKPAEASQAFGAEECRASIRARNLGQIDVADVTEVSLVDVPLKCSTKTIHFMYGTPKVEGKGTTKVTYYVNKETAEQKIKEVYANEWAECFWQTNEGKVFSKKDVQRCMICADVQIDSEVLDKTGIRKLNNFNQYLKENKYKRVGETYYDYLIGGKEGTLEDVDENYNNLLLVQYNKDGTMLVDEFGRPKPMPYSIIFTKFKPPRELKAGTSFGVVAGVSCAVGIASWWTGVGAGFLVGCGAGIGGGVFTGAIRYFEGGDDLSGVFILPFDAIPATCQQMY